jgi:PAS domain S-box-containing protein
MAGSVHDLTVDLRLAAASEARLRGRLESVFAGVAEAVVAADEQRRVTELNLAAVELLGLDDDDLDGRSLDEVVPLIGSDGYPVSLSAPSGGARVVVGTVRPADRPDAPPTPVVGTVASLHDAGGGRAGTVVVLRDVRRERALEEAKQDFLANIGHELRTPLTPIKGYAGVLRRRTPTPEQAREWSEGISAGVERLEHMVERLVTFAAVTAGPVGASGSGGEPIEVAALVAAVADHWRPRLDRPLVVDVPDGLPPLRGEPAHLRLALGELVDNAARFSPPGTPVTIRAGLVPGDDGSDPQVEVAVHDEGGGDLAGLAGAVDAFTQGEASATRRHEGLGLGLALVDRVARAHGGRLTLAARTDAPSPEGTTVSILVPVVTASAGLATAPVSAPTDPAPDEGVAP